MTNKIFTIVLEVYVNGLNASVVNLKASHEKPVDNKSVGDYSKFMLIASSYDTNSCVLIDRDWPQW